MDLSSVHATVARAIAADLTGAEVAGALSAAGIRSLMLKGPAIADLLYEQRGARSYGDVDLMVAPADRARAAEVLSGLGFRSQLVGLSDADRDALLELGKLAEHAVTWKAALQRVDVDFHSSFPGIGASDDELWRALSSGAGALELCGVTVETPGPAAVALIVALHAAWHGPAAPHPVRDLDRAIEQLDLRLWQDAASLAARLDATAAMSAGLQLLPSGRDLVTRLGLPAALDVTTRLRSYSAPHTSLGFARLGAQRGMAAKLRLLAREVVPPRLLMRHDSKLARRGPLGLAAAYVVRPFRLLAHSGRGFAAWRKAQEEAG